MAKAPKLYTRLTRNAASFGSYSSLWLAGDHLMVVRSTGYNESYTRIQLSDIKGIFLIATERRMWWTLAWGIIFGWSAVLFLIGLTSHELPIASGIFTFLGLVGLIWNYVLGQGCKAYVVTGVQTAVLPSVVRMKRARALVLMKLEPLIVAAQADLVVTPAAVAEPPVASAPAAETPASPILDAPAALATPGEAAPNPPATE